MKYTEAGKLIIQYARNKNMSLFDLAAAAKISYPHLSNMLRGTKRMNDSNVQKICNALKLNREERISVKEAVFVSNPNIIIPTTDKRLYLLKFIFLLLQRCNNISQQQIDECRKIILASPINNNTDNNSREQTPQNTSNQSREKRDVNASNNSKFEKDNSIPEETKTEQQKEQQKKFTSKHFKI